MKSVLISIHPKWCELIASGEKTIEVRKTRPKIETPFKCYIYETKARSDMPTFVDEDGHVLYTGRGQVIGEFICDKAYELVNAFGGIMFADENLNQLEPQLFRDMSCLTDEQTADYLGDKDGYGLHITDLKIYDKPRELGEFYVHKYDERDYCSGCVHHECPAIEYPCYECAGDKDNRAYLYRPPQSWCYVEELE